MINVLVNAYAVSPNWGSEPGMGWNWVINLAKYCNVHVITEGEWSNEIEEAIQKLPQKNNLHFYYIPLSDKIRKMCWNQGDWRFYWYYRKWQKKAFLKAQEIIASNPIDAIHQLNMIGFREPGYLWKLEGVPYVWGPVGGMGDIPVAYLKGAGWKQNVFCRLKNFISNFQIRFSPRVRAAARRGTMIAATKEVQDKVRHYYNIEIPLINETGCYPKNLEHKIESRSSNGPIKLLWVGKFDFRKQFELSLKSIAKTEFKDKIHMDVIAPFDNEDQRCTIVNLVTKYGLSGHITMHGRLPHDKVLTMMRHADVLLFTSIMEGTPHVVLEALQNELPVICIDTCGQGDVVTTDIGDKVALTNPDVTSSEIAAIIDGYVLNPNKLKTKSQNCFRRQLDCSWDSKIRSIVNYYKK